MIKLTASSTPFLSSSQRNTKNVFQLLKETPKGFTLIELLIVVAILAILAVIGLVTFTNAQRSTRNSRRVSDIRSIGNALELWYSTGTPAVAASGQGTYPIIGTALNAPVTLPNAVVNTNLGPFLPAGVPDDPQAGGTRNVHYTVASTATQYEVCASLTPTTGNFEGAAGSANVPAANGAANGGALARYCAYNQQ